MIELADAPNVGAEWPIWRLVNHGRLTLADVDTVDAMLVLDANEALDVHLDAEAAALLGARAAKDAEASAKPKLGR